MDNRVTMRENMAGNPHAEDDLFSEEHWNGWESLAENEEPHWTIS
jgi:hypothetical protein